MANSEKPVMLAGIDESDQSFYALEWAIDHFLTPFAPNIPFDVVLVHAKPTPTTAIGFAGPGIVIILSIQFDFVMLYAQFFS